MKKLCLILIGMQILCQMCFAASQDEEVKSYTMSFTVGQDKCIVNEQQRTIDENNSEIMPYLSDKTGQFMIPLRAFAQCLDLTVHWDESEPGAIDIMPIGLLLYIDERAEKRVSEWLETNYTQEDLQTFSRSGYFKKNTPSSLLKYPLEIADEVFFPPVAIYSEQQNDRTFVPVRPLAEMLGFSVKWEEETQTAVLEEIPVEELYTEEYNFEVVGNRLKINYHRKNNTNYPVRCTIGSPTQWLIYNEYGKRVWSTGEIGGSGVISFDMEESTEEYTGDEYSDELERGKYYFEIRGSTWRTCCYIRGIKSIRPARFHFEIK